tara:strand:- start:493 stop:612 length:120 start_codon:yes stop_codon:yes gene_type:complete
MLDPKDNQPIPEPTDAELEDIESTLTDIDNNLFDDLEDF